QCVTVDVSTACEARNFIFTAAYLGSFDPNYVCNNWIADEGTSPNTTQPFSFGVGAGQTFVMVVSEVNAYTGCPSYTMTVSGLCTGPQPTTPTPTVAPTPTPTPPSVTISGTVSYCTNPAP